MKTFVLTALAGLLAAGLGVSGCKSASGETDYTRSGALAGGAAGALLGSRRSTEGTVIGGVMGAAAGALLGKGYSTYQEKKLRDEYPRTAARIEGDQPMTPEDVRALVEAEVSDALIISQIRNAGKAADLSPKEIIDLKEDGVSDKVIDALIQAPVRRETTARERL